MLLVWVAVGYFVGRFGLANVPGISPKIILILILLFLPIFLLVIAVHELGHAVTGVMVNFDFTMYVVGPFMWNKENGKWKFGWNKNVNTAGGLVMCLPKSTENLKEKFTAFALGGPLASLLFAAVCWAIAQSLPFQMSAASIPEQVLKSSMYMLSVVSFLIFLITIIPMHLGGFSSDGARALRLMRGGEAARLEVLVLSLATQSSSGMRPRLLDQVKLKEALELAQRIKAPTEVYLHAYFHQAAWDNGDVEISEQHLLNYIEQADEVPEGMRNAVWLDAAFFYALAKKDIATAEKYWGRYKPTAMIPKAQLLATEASFLYARNEHEMAKPKIAAALLELPNMMDKGIALALKEKLVFMQGSVSAT